MCEKEGWTEKKCENRIRGAATASKNCQKAYCILNNE